MSKYTILMAYAQTKIDKNSVAQQLEKMHILQKHAWSRACGRIHIAYACTCRPLHKRTVPQCIQKSLLIQQIFQCRTARSVQVSASTAGSFECGYWMSRMSAQDDTCKMSLKSQKREDGYGFEMTHIYTGIWCCSPYCSRIFACQALRKSYSSHKHGLSGKQCLDFKNHTPRRNLQSP